MQKRSDPLFLRHVNHRRFPLRLCRFDDVLCEHCGYFASFLLSSSRTRTIFRTMNWSRSVVRQRDGVHNRFYACDVRFPHGFQFRRHVHNRFVVRAILSQAFHVFMPVLRRLYCVCRFHFLVSLPLQMEVLRWSVVNEVDMVENFRLGCFLTIVLSSSPDLQVSSAPCVQYTQVRRRLPRQSYGSEDVPTIR